MNEVLNGNRSQLGYFGCNISDSKLSSSSDENYGAAPSET
jgi:hypothetical protein